MGHLINPISTRLGFSTFWISSWTTTQLGTYSYYILLDSILVELISYFFYYSSTVDFLSKFGFFFSHFRLIRRSLHNFCIKVFFIPNTATILSKTFVELENSERLNFAFLLGFKFLRLSKFVRTWLKSRVSHIIERQLLFRLRTPRFVRGDLTLRLKERFLFFKKMFLWTPKKKIKAVRWGLFYKNVLNKLQQRLLFKKKFNKNFPVVSQFATLISKSGETRRFLCKILNTTKRLIFGNKYFTHLFVPKDLSGFGKILTKIHHTFPLRISKKPKALVISKLKIFKQRFLASVAFSRLRRTSLALSLFNYLSLLYSGFVTESLNLLPLSKKFFKNTVKASVTFSLLSKFKLLNPQFLARFIAKRLTYGMPLRRVLKPIVIDLTRSVENPSQMLCGFRIKCAGRFNRAQMASVSVERMGNLSLSSMQSLVSLGYSTAFLRYGACGIKVWVAAQKWSSNSSIVSNTKFEVLKILNSIIIRVFKQGKGITKSYFYNYLISFFLINGFVLEESAKRLVLQKVQEFSLCNIMVFSILKLYHVFLNKRRVIKRLLVRKKKQQKYKKKSKVIASNLYLKNKQKEDALKLNTSPMFTKNTKVNKKLYKKASLTTF